MLFDDVGGQPAITVVPTGETLTRGELAEMVQRFAYWLHTGDPAGGRVAILLRNQIQYPAVVLAARLAGFPHLPLNTHTGLTDQLAILDEFGPTVVVVDESFGEIAEGLADRFGNDVRLVMVGKPRAGWEGLDDILASSSATPVLADQPGPLLLLSGGSTGRSKIVDRPGTGQSGLLGFLPMHDQTVTVIPTPLYHTMGTVWMLSILDGGGHVLIMEEWDTEGLLQVIQQYNVTLLPLVPTMMYRLMRLPDDVRNAYDVSSLEAVLHGAAPCSSELKAEFVAWIPCLYEVYGMTENFGITISTPTDAIYRPSSVGRPMGCTIVIRDEAGRALPDGKTGIVWFGREDGVEMKYLGAPDETAACYNEHREGTAFDVGHLRNGYLYLSGRKKAMIIVGGVNVFPAEIEAALMEHDVVADVCVVGKQHDELGEIPVAVVQVTGPNRDTALATALRTWCRSRLDGLRTPQIVFVDKLPRQGTGKINLPAVRELVG